MYFLSCLSSVLCLDFSHLIYLTSLPFNLPSCRTRVVHAAVPDFPAGAMENWGLILYRESSLLYDPRTASASNQQRVASVVAHELAHMVTYTNSNGIDFAHIVDYWLIR